MLRLLTNLKTVSLLVESNDNWLDQFEWDLVSSADFDPAHRTADGAFPAPIIFHKPLDSCSTRSAARHLRASKIRFPSLCHFPDIS